MRHALFLALLLPLRCFAFEPGPCAGSVEQRRVALTTVIDAALAHRRERGRWPDYVEALAPAYLPAIPEHAIGYLVDFPDQGDVIFALCNFEPSGNSFEQCEFRVSTGALSCRERRRIVLPANQ
jgi:hypothetical protein